MPPVRNNLKTGQVCIFGNVRKRVCTEPIHFLAVKKSWHPRCVTWGVRGAQPIRAIFRQREERRGGKGEEERGTHAGRRGMMGGGAGGGKDGSEVLGSQAR